MRLAICIVSWNTKGLLRDCLQSLNSNCDLLKVRVIVVDNASADGTPEMLREEFPWVTLVESGGNLGFGRASNLGIRASNEPYVLFLNPDTLFLDNAHEQMLEVFERNPKVGLVGCQMYNPDGSVQQLGLQCNTSPLSEVVTGFMLSRLTYPLARRLLPIHDPLQDGFVKKLYGGCLMARRATLDQIGLFDDRFFMYCEDVDLSRRAGEADWELYYLGSTKIIHVGGGASAKAPGRFSVLMQCESTSKLMEKYYGRWGKQWHRMITFFKASGRLMVIYLAKAMFILRFAGSNSKRSILEGAQKKNVAILQWSLGRTRAVVP